MRIWLPREGGGRGELLSNPSLYRRLVSNLVYLIVTHPNISYVIHQVSQYLSASRSTHYVAILHILRYLKGTLFHGLFYSTQSPFVLRDSLMLTGQEISLIAGPPLVIAFFLAILWFPGEVRNKPLWPAPVLKQNIMLLLISHLSSFDYDGLLIVTTRVPFILLTMMSSMNGLNTSRSIVILSIIILSMMLSSYSRSLLKINLQIFSPSHILKGRLRALVDNLKLVLHPPWVWKGVVTV